MLIASARSAAVLAAQIDAINLRIEAIDAAIANSATIAGGNIIIVDAIAGNREITLLPQTIADTATVLETMKGILQGKLTTLSGTLSALS